MIGLFPFLKRYFGINGINEMYGLRQLVPPTTVLAFLPRRNCFNIQECQNFRNSKTQQSSENVKPIRNTLKNMKRNSPAQEFLNI